MLISLVILFVGLVMILNGWDPTAPGAGWQWVLAVLAVLAILFVVAQLPGRNKQ